MFSFAVKLRKASGMQRNGKKNKAKKPKKPKEAGMFTVPASNIVTRRTVNPLQVALNRTPLLPAFTKVPKMLYYVTNLSLTAPNTGAVVSYVFSANGMFDPDITGTGHQPIGFDQMMALYEQYTVTRSVINCRFRPNSRMQFGIALSPDTAVITNPSQFVENGLVNFRAYSGFGSTEVGIPIPNLSLSCDVKGYFGPMTEREMLNNVNLFGTAAANPTEQVYFMISAWQGIGLDASAHNCDFDALISYDAIFWEPRKVGESVGKGVRGDSSRELKAPAYSVSADGRTKPPECEPDFEVLRVPLRARAVGKATQPIKVVFTDTALKP